MPSDDANQEAGDDAVDRVIDASEQTPAGSRSEGMSAVSPDVVEQELGSEIDNIVPTRGYRLIPTVGLGGSAGSIQALGAFFEAMPAVSGLVFVVVVHLSPEHESILAELLGRHTAMPVRQAEDGMPAEANHVYVIPPGKHLLSVDGHLKLSSPDSVRGSRMAVDVFFRTLADTHGAHAAAIVLSGADGDGAIGLKRIKERGGVTVAQDPGEAEHEGMPRAAIGTGMVDWVLRVEDMPARLNEYFAREKSLHLPPEDHPASAPLALVSPDAQEATLRELLAFVHTRTGRDFSCYKRATVLRRISRRMQINARETLAEYLTFLRTHPGESGALLQDLLISVTNFFRDREAFATLETHVPHLFRNKGSNDTVRVWVAACATGEEAYSVAMLLFEHARTLDAPPSIQVFATDLAEEVVQSARDGVFPSAISTDVSEERLARFFIQEPRGYRVRRELREAVLFAQHDLLKDSPFSKIDLVTCRNLLIYLDRDAQKRALDVFHFSLVQRGLLFLGTSETVEDNSDLFVPLDKKHRLFAAQPAVKTGLPVPVGVGTLARALQEREHGTERPVLPDLHPTDAALRDLESLPGKRPSHELQLRILAQAGPPAMIVDTRHHIVHLSGATSRYLQFDAGEFTPDLLAVIHPMLRTELRGVLARATQTRQPAEALAVPIDLDGQRQTVDLRVTPGQYVAADYLVVTFHAVPAAVPVGEAVLTQRRDDSATQQLEHQLEESRRHLRAVQEQHEVTLEEHKAGHEELQAINEELRSASEELETSREELQAINEELTTVNQELKARVDELGHSNGDLHNLMAATNIATMFLDREMRITRYTPAAVSLFKLIPTDVGRPLDDIKHRLDYPDLEADARQVLATLAVMEREVSKTDDGWFLARLQPYRSLDDHIAGVVLTFVDITARKQAETALRESEARLGADLAGMRRLYELHARLANETDLTAALQAILAASCEFTGTSRGCVQLVSDDGARLEMIAYQGYAAGSVFIEHFRFEGSQPACDAVRWQRQRLVIEDVEKFPPLQGTRDLEVARADGIRATQSTPIVSRGGDLVGVLNNQFTEPHRPSEDQLRLIDLLAWTAADFVARHRADLALRHSEQRLQRMVNVPRVGVLTFDFTGTLLSANDAFLDMLGYGRGEFTERTFVWQDFTPPEHLQESDRQMEQMRTTGRLGPYEKEYFRKDGSRVWLMFVAADLGDNTLVEYAVDVSDRKRAEEALRESEVKIMAVFEALPVGVGFFAKNGELVYSNRDLQRYLPNAKLPSRDDSQVGRWRAWHPDGRPVERNDYPGARALRGEKVIPGVEMLHTQEDGEEAWTQVAAVPLTDDEGQIIGEVVVIADIDALKRVEEALHVSLREIEHARAEAEAANAAKDQFLAVLSHELRTPLMPIAMGLAMLRKRDDLPEPVRKALEMIKRNVELETHFIDDLLDVTRIARGKMEVVRTPMDLHAAIQAAAEVSASDVEGKGQALTLDLEAAEGRVNGDFARLQQVFWNLLKNASKFTPESGTIRVVSRNQSGGQIVVEVTDTGIGMDADAIARVFRPFEQANVAITREFGGLGLGLAIATGTVEAHGGTLRATSPGPNQGTTFVVSLPLDPGAGSVATAG